VAALLATLATTRCGYGTARDDAILHGIVEDGA
jgi:hypothetical protein